MFTASFWRYLFNIPAFSQALPRAGNLVMDQIPLLAGRLSAQADNLAAGLVVLLLFHFGIIYYVKKLRGSGVTAVAVLALCLFVPLWFYNPSVMTAQGMDKQLLPLVLLMGGWAVAGALLLYGMLIAWARKLQATMELGNSRLERLVTAVLFVVLVAAMVAPGYSRWLKSDMSGYFVFRDMGTNQLSGMEQGGILIVTGAAEYYRVLYAGEVLYQGENNYSLIDYQSLNRKRYIHDLKDQEQALPMDLEDSDIDALRPVRLEQPESFRAGELTVNYPPETVFMIPDLALMSVIRANGFERPVYFSFNFAPENMLGLSGFVASRGLTNRLFEQDPLTSEDSTNYYRGDLQIAVDIPWTQQLLWGYYRHHTTLWDASGDEHDERYRPLLVYARAHANLAEALLGKGGGDAAASNYRQCEFFDPDYENKLLIFASRLAEKGFYEQSKVLADAYFENVPPDPLKWAGLAKIALANADSVPATEMLVKSLEADPDFLLGYQKLIRLFHEMGQHTMVSAYISRWLTRHSTDEQTKQLWEEYNATKTLPPGFPE